MNYKNIAKLFFIIIVLFFISCGEDSKTESNKECSPACSNWETCNNEFKCVVQDNKCNEDKDCKDNFVCYTENHTCEEKRIASEILLPFDRCGRFSSCNDSFECSPDKRCENLQVDADQNGVSDGITRPCCVEAPRGYKKTGESCKTEFDCESGLCVSKNDGNFICSRVCDQNNNTCPEPISECKDLYVMFMCVEPS